MTQMLENARRALEVVRTRQGSDLDQDWVLQMALTKAVEVVGEAASRVSNETRAQFREIPWREAITTRNRLTHGYDTIDHEILWQTIRNDFPPLVAALEKALASLSGPFDQGR